MKKILAVVLTIMLVVGVMPMSIFTTTASAATSGTTGDCTWKLNGTVLTISGNGAMGYTYSYNPNGWGSFSNPWGKDVTKVIIEEGVTRISSNAFTDCVDLFSVTIPSSVTSIGSSAFENCKSLSSVIISDIKAWCEIDFSGSSSNPLYGPISYGNSLPASLYINGEVFFDGFYSSSITIPENISVIKDYAFSGIRYKNTTCAVSIPNSVTTIESNAFAGAEVKIYCDYGSCAAEYAKNRGIPYFLLNVPAPEKPEVLSITSSSVTLVSVSGYEYSKDGTNWQTSAVFSGLKANSRYTFYQRIAATWRSVASATSEGCAVKTLRSTPAVPEAPLLSASTSNSVTLVRMSGYEYSMDGINWQTSTYFGGLQPITQYSFYQRVAETTNSYASSASPVLKVTTLKKSNANVPQAPVLVEAGQTSVKLVKIVNYEYSKDGVNWQSSSVFENLTPNTEYTFYQRIKETGDTYASSSSAGLKVKTGSKGACPNAPKKPIVVSMTAHSVTLQALDGYEYKCGNGEWQSSPVFNLLSLDTSYTFYQRIKATTTYNASASSQGVTVKTPMLSSTTNYDSLVEYINLFGTTYNGNKRVSFRYNSKYYLRFTNTSTGVEISMEDTAYSGSTTMEGKMSFTLKPKDRNINVGYTVKMYYNNSLMSTYNPSATVDRATYTPDTVVPISGYAVGSNMSDMFNSYLALMCGLINEALYEEMIGVTIGGIGFLKYNGDFDSTFYCDSASGHHIGTKVLKYNRSATCTEGGYSGDYCCSYCGDVITKGTATSSLGGHKYNNSCDESCNTCGHIREVQHIYSNDCDTSCNTCDAKRTVVHVYDSVCDEACNLCNATRKATHNFTDKNDLTCNDCGYERPPYTPGDVTGDDKINSLDGLMLLRHLNGWNLNIASPEAMDVNGDGKVNSLDGLMLMRYLNGWNINLG